MARPDENEFLGVLEQWNRAYGSRYELRECDLLWNLNAQDLVVYSQTRLAGVPVIFAEASPSGEQLGISKKSIWLSLWGEIPRQRVSDFLKAFIELAESRSRSRLVMGADEFHFSPGVPSDVESGSHFIDALKQFGFDGAEAVDFVGPSRSEAVDGYIQGSFELARAGGWRFLQVESDTDHAELSEFLAHEFPGRWHREFVIWRSRNDTTRAFWMVLKQTSNEVLGFARMALRGRMQPLSVGWSPGAIRLPLRASDDPARDWNTHDSCLGPIGIAKSQRGKGAGRILLGAVLASLQKHNAGRICIDWTNAFKYYLPLHFEITRRYWTAWKTLS